MAEIRLNRREVGELIGDGSLLAHCPKCAAELHLRLSDLGVPAPDRSGEARKAADKKAEWTQPKCVTCNKPITPYAFAVRKGLCPECFAIGGGRLDKPGRPPEPPPPETAAAGPGPAP